MSDWVKCPVCGEHAMRKEIVGQEGEALIHCVNHSCASNGGSNASALSRPTPPSVLQTETEIGFSEEELSKLRKVAGIKIVDLPGPYFQTETDAVAVPEPFDNVSPRNLRNDLEALFRKSSPYLSRLMRYADAWELDRARALAAQDSGLREALRKTLHLAKAYVRYTGGMSDNSDHETIAEADALLSTHPHDGEKTHG
jgi:hypothetical protein